MDYVGSGRQLVWLDWNAPHNLVSGIIAGKVLFSAFTGIEICYSGF